MIIISLTTVHLVLLAPGVRLSSGLLQLEAEVLGATEFLLMLLPQTLALKKDYWLYEKIRVIIPSYHVLHVPELAQDAGPLPGLAVCHRLLLLQSRQQP